MSNDDRPTIDEAREARELAVQQVEANASAEWTEAALAAVTQVAAAKPRFIADDVWTALLEQGVTTHEPRAMGSLMRRAMKEGLCHLATCGKCGTTKVMTTGRSRASHAGDVPVYVAGPVPAQEFVDDKERALRAAAELQLAYLQSKERGQAIRVAILAGATYREVAERMGLSAGNVHSLASKP